MIDCDKMSAMQEQQDKAMQLEVNGATQDFSDPLTAAELIQHLGLTERRLAMEINGELLPRSHFASHQLRSGDKVEIVQAIGGG